MGNLATNKNIIMKQFNGTDYDTLYPKTVAAQIDDVYSKDETYPNLNFIRNLSFILNSRF